jgi:SAM-dependent methyltransferase
MGGAASFDEGIIMDTTFDHALASLRLDRATATRDAGAAFLMERAAEDLEERISTVERRFDAAAVLYSRSEAPRAALRRSGKALSVTRVEWQPGLAADAVVADPEILPFGDGELDLAVSLYALDTTNDAPGMLIQIRRALRPDGLFLGCMAGAGTLAELREALLAAETELTGGASPRVHPFADVRAAGALLQRAGFALPVTDHETVTVRYDTMFALIRDLRAMGATSVLAERAPKPASRALFLRAAEIYADRFSDPDGRVRATFSTIWMSGWAPHHSQQQPLKPGSAKVSLAQVLGSRDD